MKTYNQIFRELGIKKPNYCALTGDYLFLMGKRRRKRAYRQLIIMWGVMPPEPDKKDLFFKHKGRNATPEELRQLAQCVDFEMWVCNYDTKHNFDL